MEFQAFIKSYTPQSLLREPYNLESYKKAGVKKDEFEEGREQALVGIFKSRYLKRFESSIAAFRISIKRALELARENLKLICFDYLCS
jgi:hypothetical protein